MNPVLVVGEPNLLLLSDIAGNYKMGFAMIAADPKMSPDDLAQLCYKFLWGHNRGFLVIQDAHLIENQATARVLMDPPKEVFKEWVVVVSFDSTQSQQIRVWESMRPKEVDDAIVTAEA